MKEELVARRQQAEDAFTKLNASLEAIAQELKKYGFATVDQAEEELHRLQGEYRVLTDFIQHAETDEALKTVSPTPDTINVAAATKGKK